MALVIVGGGHAGGQAAASLRQEGYAGPVVLLAEEPHVPYQRPPLSKQYLAGEWGLERVHLRPASFYASRDIDVRPGAKAAGIDAAARTVLCEDGATVPYQRLLLATGTRPRQLEVPGAARPGVHCLRTIADAEAIKAALKPGVRLAVVGGGYIGLEVAAVAAAMGLAVTVLEMEERLLKRVATPAMSTFYEDLHRQRGVAIRTGAEVVAFAGSSGAGSSGAGSTGAGTGGERLAAVECANGERVAADVAVVGVGVAPNVELAAAAGLACDDGILVDEHARTSDPGIYAAGDCTNHPNPILGRRLRLESVPNAMEQSRVAAANMAGASKRYAAVPWFWSDQYDLKLQMAGFPEAGDDAVLRGDPAERRFATFYLRQGRLAAAEAVNCPREFMAARQLLGKRVDGRDLADPATDMKAVLAAAAA